MASRKEYLDYVLEQLSDLEGVDVSRETLADLLSVDKALWTEEVAGIRDFYQQFGDKLPKALADELDALEARLKA